MNITSEVTEAGDVEVRLEPRPQTRPPKFKECPFCRREFGSRSLQIHITKCAARPPAVVAAAAAKAKAAAAAAAASSSDDVETSLSEELSESWPRRHRWRRGEAAGAAERTARTASDNEQRQSRHPRRRPRRERRLDRPQTAVLRRPTVLDEALRDKVDMTMTKKQFLAAVKLCADLSERQKHPLKQPQADIKQPPHRALPAMRNRRAPVGYKRTERSDFKIAKRVGNSQREDVKVNPVAVLTPSPERRKRRAKKDQQHSNLKETSTDTSPERPRPGTTRLAHPANPSVDLPKILPNPRAALRAARAAKAAAAAAAAAKAAVEVVATDDADDGRGGGRDSPKKAIPEPCNSCGRTDLPERFHTHPPPEQEQQQQSKIRQASPPKRITPLEEKVAEIVANEKKKRSPYEASSPASSSKKKGQSNGRSRRKVRLRLRPPTAAGAAATADSSAATSSNASATKEDNSSDGEVVVVIRGGDSNGKLAGERLSRDDSSDNQASCSSNASGGSTGSTVNNKSSEAKTSSSNDETNNNSRTAKCSICGKEFGKVSIKFHEPQCIKKAAAQKAKAAREQKEREEKERAANAYTDYSYFEGERDTPFDETFDAIWEAHVQQLMPCDLCGRTFFPDRIGVHKRWCKGEKPLKVSSVISLQQPQQQPQQQPPPDKAKAAAAAAAVAASSISLQQSPQPQSSDPSTSASPVKVASTSLADLVSRITDSGEKK